MILDCRPLSQRNQPFLHVLLGSLKPELQEERVLHLLEPGPCGLFPFENLEYRHRVARVDDVARGTYWGAESCPDRLGALSETGHEIAAPELL